MAVLCFNMILISLIAKTELPMHLSGRQPFLWNALLNAVGFDLGFNFAICKSAITVNGCTGG